MTEGQMEKTAGLLKEIADREGPGYLKEEPYRVYKERMGSGLADNKTSGGILLFLVNGMTECIREGMDAAELSGMIQRTCGFNKRLSGRVTEIILSVYSRVNIEEWEKKDQEGLAHFIKEEHDFTWKGCSVWDVGTGSVTCHYDARMCLRTAGSFEPDRELADLLNRKPFTTADMIREYYEGKLKKYLDYEFEDYCTCDDYYQPVVEDFELDYRVKDWCRENGFEVIFCEGEGEDDGYEPTFRRGGWY